MSIVKIKDKRIGVIYVYEQEKSVWDPEKKQARSKRTLIGKIDPETGEIVPTCRSGRKKSVEKAVANGEFMKVFDDQQKQIDALKQEVAELRLALAVLKEMMTGN